MNKTTTKILIIAISAIVVIVTATGAYFAYPMVKDLLTKDNETTTAATTDEYKRPQATSPNSNGVVAPTLPGITVETPSEMTTLDSILSSTQNALNPNNKPTSATTPTRPANNGGSNNGGSNNAGGSNSNPNYGSTQSGLNVKDLIDENGVQVAGYRYSNEGDGYYYTDDKDCWQKNAGYNEVYDQMAPLTAMFIDQVRVRFNYGGKDWMVQLWKGQYGWLLVGAEIGLYTAEEGANSGAINEINHYNCADQEDWLYMSMDCYWAEGNNGHYKKVFSRPYDKYWWPTGFVKGQLTKYTWPRTELKMKGRITFKDEAMADAFVAELKKSGFARAAGSSSSQLADDTYYQNGADVVFLWSTIYHDCFK